MYPISITNSLSIAEVKINPSECDPTAKIIEATKKTLEQLKNNTFPGLNEFQRLSSLKATQSYLDNRIAEYNLTGCGIDLKMDRCLYIEARTSYLENQINQLSTEIIGHDTSTSDYNLAEMNTELDSLKQEALSLNCIAKVEESRQKIVSDIAQQSAISDKARIDAQTTKQVNNRLLLSGIVLVSATIMIILLSSKK